MAVAEAKDIKVTMENVRKFSFDKGLFGQGAASADFVGIIFPDKSFLGSKRVTVHLPLNILIYIDQTNMPAANNHCKSLKF